MKIWLSSAAALIVFASAGASASPVGRQHGAAASKAAGAQTAANTPQTGSVPPTADQKAEIYYDFTMAHLYQQQYINSNSSDDANKALDLYKKAYALDPSSQVIGEQL